MTSPIPPVTDRMVLHDFVARYRQDIIDRTQEKVRSRPSSGVALDGLETGVPLFLTQLAETLKQEADGVPPGNNAIGASAARHGGELLSLGFTVSEVVHTYGDVCQAVTELAVEKEAPISTTEFHSLNRCLDTAIAEAVTEHARLTAEWRSTGEAERIGRMAHEIRNHLNSALLAFDSLRRGVVAVNGSTGAVLGRSLLSLRDVVDITVADIRMGAVPQHRRPLSVLAFLTDAAVGAALHAEYQGLQFTLLPVDPALTVNADPHLLGSALTNLLSNAFKFTREGGAVTLMARALDGRVYISVEDQCGGIPPTAADPFKPFGDRRGRDRTGLGLGLSIARRAVRSQEGDITILNKPDTGCVFTIELPLAADTAA